MKPLFTILLLVIHFIVQAQSLRPNVQVFVDSIIETGHIPIKNSFNMIDSAAFRLGRLATNEELLSLANHENATVRGRVLFLLLDRADSKDIDFPKLFEEHLFDTALVSFKYVNEYYRANSEQVMVCQLYAQFVGGYFGQIKHRILSKHYQPNPQEKQVMDSLVLCQVVPLTEEKANLLWFSKPYPTFYPHIRRQVIDLRDENAVIYLAKYQKEKDIDLILNNLPVRNKAMGYLSKHWDPLHFFQHPRMFEFLEKSFDEHWQEMRYMQRVAEYKSAEAAELLERIYQHTKREKRAHYLRSILCNAMYANYVEAYSSLYITIMSEVGPVRIPNKLWLYEGDTLFQFYQKWSVSTNKWVKDDAKSMYPKVKAYMNKKNLNKTHEIVLGQIKAGMNYEKAAKSFLDIFRTKDMVYVEPLFKLLEEEPYAKQRFFLVQILMSYKNADINQRLIAFFEEHPELIPNIRAAEEGGRLFVNLPYIAKW